MAYSSIAPLKAKQRCICFWEKSLSKSESLQEVKIIQAFLSFEIIEIIKGLGLSNTRYSYLSSMVTFIEEYKDTILQKIDERTQL